MVIETEDSNELPPVKVDELITLRSDLLAALDGPDLEVTVTVTIKGRVSIGQFLSMLVLGAVLVAYSAEGDQVFRSMSIAGSTVAL